MGNWQDVELKEVCYFENGDRGKNYPSRKHYVENGIPFLTAGNLSNNGIKHDDLNYITEEHYDRLSNGKVIDGDLIFCLRGSLGKFAKVSNIKLGAIASSLVIVRALENISTNFLMYYFQSDLTKKMIDQYDNGSAQPNLSANNLKKFKIPLPPIETQQQIVTKLDALFERIDNSIALLEENIQHTKDLMASVLDEEFGKLLELGAVKASEIGKVIRGSSPRPKGDPRYYGGNVPRLMVADVTRDGMYVTPNIDFLTDEGAKKSRPCKKGTLIIQVSGNPGTPSILNIDACIHDGFAAIININENDWSIPFLYHYLWMKKLEHENMAKGATFQNIKTDIIRDFDIPNIDKGLQIKAVDNIDNKNKVIENLINQQTDKLNNLKALKSSLLDKAFKGELV